MKRLLLIATIYGPLIITLLATSVSSCVEREQFVPEDVSEFATVIMDDEGGYIVRFDKELHTQLTEEHGEYTITRTSMGNDVWSYKFFDRMNDLIAYANVSIGQDDDEGEEIVKPRDSILVQFL